MTGRGVARADSPNPGPRALRMAAVACLVMSLPAAFLRYPWLPATIIEYRDLRHAPSAGTPSYQQDHGEQIERTQQALLLYAAGTLALAGLLAIASGVLPWWAEMLAWLLAAATGYEIARFGEAYVAPSTDSAYVIATVKLPFVIAIVAAFAALLRLVLQLNRFRSQPA